MLLQGLVLSGDVLESTFYDQSTGQPKPGYSVKLTVLDTETDEKYECQLSDGFPSLDQLKDLKKQGQPVDVLQQVAAQLRNELPPKMTPITLVVRRIKGKGSFLTLVCGMAPMMSKCLRLRLKKEVMNEIHAARAKAAHPYLGAAGGA